MILNCLKKQYQNDNIKAKEAIDDLKRQSSELEKIETSIRQVHQFFVDMATLIEHQVSLNFKIKTYEINALFLF